MSKKLYSLMAILVLAAMILSACGGAAATQAPAATEAPVVTEAPAATEAPVATEAPTEVPAATEAPTEVPAATEAPVAQFKLCNVNDMGGVDDKSFNATAWKGATDAATEYGVDAKYLESAQQTDYEKNLNAYVQEKCDLTIAVGFLLGDALKKVAEANPDMKFAIIDSVYDPVIPNVRASAFEINTATYLAGYLAASQSQTGKVGTYGGMQFPAVTAFMDGFALGVTKYNEVHGTDVKVLGWDIKTQKGLFTGDFSDVDKGKATTLALLDEGADVIMPVAGPVGQGTLAAIKERGTGLMIGVDTDWSAMYPEDASIILGSALKAMDLFVKETTKLAMDGQFKGETWVGNLQNNGVGLAIGSAFKDKVSADIQKEIDGLKADIIAGKIKVEVPK
jgi:basic membrane protein A and related proteins